jgi:hypothetical protein
MTGASCATEIEHLNRLRRGKSRVTLMLDDDLLQSSVSCKRWSGHAVTTCSSASSPLSMISLDSRVR